MKNRWKLCWNGQIFKANENQLVRKKPVRQKKRIIRVRVCV